jgi:hypothetical protein
LFFCLFFVFSAFTKSLFLFALAFVLAFVCCLFAALTKSLLFFLFLNFKF